MNDEPITDSNLVSSCCGMPVYSNTDICSDCKEHCSPESPMCGNCGCEMEKASEYGFCPDCEDNEIIGMKYG